MGKAKDPLSQLREFWEEPCTITFTASYTPPKKIGSGQHGRWSVTAEGEYISGLVFVKHLAELSVETALDESMPYGPDVGDRIAEENMGEDA